METLTLTCKDCGESFDISLTQEEIDNDYDITCDTCGRFKPISRYENG